MGVLLPFIRARLTIQCDSWTSAKPDGGKTMPSKLEQTDKGTPFSRDFPTIIFDTFLTWNMPCVFSNNAFKIETDGQRNTFFLMIFSLLSAQVDMNYTMCFPKQCLQNWNRRTKGNFFSYWIYDIVLNQGHLKKRKKGYSIFLSQDRIQFKRLAFPNWCLPNKNKEMGNIAIGSFFRAPLSKQN